MQKCFSVMLKSESVLLALSLALVFSSVGYGPISAWAQENVAGTGILLSSFAGLSMLSAYADNGNLVFTDSNSTSVPAIDPTTVAVLPSSPAPNPGAADTFTITVADSSASPTTPTGTVQLSDNGAGGVFNPASCTLSSGSCAVSYAIPANPGAAITITASYGGDPSHGTSAGTSTLAIIQLDHTGTTISPTTAVLPSNDTLTFSVQVADTSGSKALSGTVTFSDGHNGGTFNPASCAMPVPTCITTYTSPANPLNVITVNATYSGDGTHSASFAISQISTSATNSTTGRGANAADQTITSVKASPSAFTGGGKVEITATVTDSSNPSSSMIGIMSWSDGGAGGVFTPNNCLLVGNQCTLTYTAPSSPAGSITITATYAGDSGHLGSSGTALLSAPAANAQNATSAPVPPPSSQPPASQPSVSANPPTSPANPAAPTPSNARPSQPPTTPPSAPATTPATGPATAQASQPLASQPPASQPSAPVAPLATTATPQTASAPAIPVRQVINAPEYIFEKIFSLIENIFKKI